jgi:hypothetical protein
MEMPRQIQMCHPKQNSQWGLVGPAVQLIITSNSFTIRHDNEMTSHSGSRGRTSVESVSRKPLLSQPILLASLDKRLVHCTPNSVCWSCPLIL